jgi:hypothetical protein
VVADFVRGRFGALAIANPDFTDFEPVCLCQLDYRVFVVGVPGFEPGRSDGALCSTGRRGQPYPPDTRTFLLTNLAESLGIEPSRA